MTIEVRKIQESDIDGFRAALVSVVNEKKFLATTEPPSPESTDEFIRRNIANDYAEFVAVIEGGIVGWADIIPFEKEIMKHAGLLGMGVIAEHRGKGIGKALLTRTIQQAHDNGLKRVELEVFAYNAVAIALYKQLGFELEGTKRKARYINDAYEDICIMGLWLDD